MMPCTSIILREFSEAPYNILTVLSPDLCYDYLLCETGHNFYTSQSWGREFWGHLINKPKNLEFFLIDPPSYIDFHFILCNGRLEQYSLAEHVSKVYHIPIVSINRSGVNGLDRNQHFPSIKNRNGNISVYDSREIMENWGGIGAIIPPGIPPIFNKEGRDERIDVLMLEPKNPQQEEMCRIIGNEFSTEYLFGRDLEDLAKQMKKCRVFVDINGPEFSVSSMFAIAAGCQIVAVNRIESSPYLHTNDKFSKLSELIDCIKDKLENPTQNNIEFNTQENFNESYNSIFKKASEILYEK